MSNLKLGRIYFGIQEGTRKRWVHISSMWNGKYPNKFDISFSHKNPNSGDWVKATEMRFEDGSVVSLKNVYPKLSLEDGYAIVGPGMDAQDDEPAPFSGGADNQLPF